MAASDRARERIPSRSGERLLSLFYLLRNEVITGWREGKKMRRWNKIEIGVGGFRPARFNSVSVVEDSVWD